MFEKKVTVEQKKQAEKEAKTIKKLEKKEQKNKNDSKALSIVKTIMIPAVFAAIVVCAIYVAMENKAQDLSNKTGVVFLKEDIKVNTFITKDAIDSYFEIKSIDQTAVPANAYKSLSDLPKDGFYVERNMEASQMVLKSDISEKDAIMDKYKNGYQVTSFAADSFDGGVNGSLRRGDIVDVYALDPSLDQLVLMAENVYVSDVYDSSGNKISTDEEIATAFTVYVTPEEVEQMNMAVCFGHIQMYLKTE